MQIKKSRKLPAVPAEETKQTADERLAWAAGSEQFSRRDPLYHVTENFQQTFDRIGKSHARAAAGGFTEDSLSEDGAKTKESEEKQLQKKAGVAREEEKSQRLWIGNAPSALTRFSNTAFQRGAMSASVLNGTGKMMLVSCLKRSVGESGPKRIQEQTLIGTGSQIRNIPGRSPDQMVFNRSFAKGALGIVVDTLRDARRVVDSMTDIAQGTGEMPTQDSMTMKTIYPFLDDSRDAVLEAEYREKLAHCTDEREKPILQNALVQTLSLRAKKAQMKNEFINKLRFLSDRAVETLSELEAPGVLDELVSSVWDEDMPELPENPDEEGDDENPDGAEDGSGTPNRSRQG